MFGQIVKPIERTCEQFYNDIPWNNVQLSVLTTWLEHRSGCPAITLLDKSCTCGLLLQLVHTKYPNANLPTMHIIMEDGTPPGNYLG